MAIASRRNKWIDIPHEPGERLQIRALTGAQLREARDARANKARERYMRMLSVMPESMLKAAEEGSKEDAEAAIEAAKASGEIAAEDVDALKGAVTDAAPADLSRPELYDVDACVRVGVIGWSYKDAAGNPIPFKLGDGLELDEPTLDLAWREVVKFSTLPPGEASAYEGMSASG